MLHFTITRGNRQWSTTISRSKTAYFVRHSGDLYLSWHPVYGTTVYSGGNGVVVSASWKSGSVAQAVNCVGGGNMLSLGGDNGSNSGTFATNIAIMEFTHVNVCWSIVLKERIVYATLTTTEPMPTTGIYTTIHDPTHYPNKYPNNYTTNFPNKYPNNYPNNFPTHYTNN